MSKVKNIGIIIRHAPYGKHFAQESLDAILAASVYGQKLTLIFMGDGVLQLLKDQQPQEIQQKSLQKQLTALALYDIERVFVCEHSLEQRAIDSSRLSIPTTQLDQEHLRILLHEQDSLLSF
ncbi:MAG: sulfurtransferase complex subunit TusC [Cellvibrionaceae bacterium]